MAEETKVAESLEELEADGTGCEYKIIEGFAKGKSIIIGSLTAGDLMEWTEAGEGEAKKTAGSRLITKSLCNSKGERYAEDPKNIALFRKKDHKASERIIKEILALNGLEVKEQESTKKD